MSNPIDSLSDSGVHRLSQRQGSGSGQASDPVEHAEGGTRSPDLLDLTGRARELRNLEKDLASEPAFDQARVDALRQSLSDGSYRVDPQRIADKLLAFENQLP